MATASRSQGMLLNGKYLIWDEAYQSLNRGGVTHEMSDQVQAYTNRAIGVSGAMRNKL